MSGRCQKLDFTDAAREFSAARGRVRNDRNKQGRQQPHHFSLLRQSTAAQAPAALSEDFGEGDFDLDGFSSKHAVFDFTAALGRMNVCPMALGIDHPNIRNTERQIVLDAPLQSVPAVVRQEDLDT